MLDRLKKWLAEHHISPVVILAGMNVIFVAAFLVVLVLFLQSRSVPATPQVIVMPNSTANAQGGDLPTAVLQVQGLPVTGVATLTPGPSPTAPSNPFDVGGTIAIALRRSARTNLWAIIPGQPLPTRLTAGPWDDRDPAWSPGGKQLAFASNRSGSWDLYLLEMESGKVTRLTNAPGFEGNPS
ncbi:MAG TPA: hypothetical protein VJL59_10710, partial [Anaerolineales bacterium]|nr:hypothetical protein [Anaerolineales bacterium]